MARSMGLIWIALGLLIVCSMVWAMAVISPASDWAWIAPAITAYIILLTLLGGAIFVLVQYVGRG